VVADVEAELGALADLAQDDRVVVRIAVGGLGVGRVGDADGEVIAVGDDRLELALELLDPSRDLAHPRDRLLGVGSLPLRGPDRVGRLVALGPQALDLRQQLAPAGVEIEQPVQVLGGSDPLQGGPGGRRVLADAAQIEQLS
jgi:hypothetical protein